MAKRKGGKRFKKAPLSVLENAAFKLTKKVLARGGKPQAHSHAEMSRDAKKTYNQS